MKFDDPIRPCRCVSVGSETGRTAISLVLQRGDVKSRRLIRVPVVDWVASAAAGRMADAFTGSWDGHAVARACRACWYVRTARKAIGIDVAKFIGELVVYSFLPGFRIAILAGKRGWGRGNFGNDPQAGNIFPPGVDQGGLDPPLDKRAWLIGVGKLLLPTSYRPDG